MKPTQYTCFPPGDHEVIKFCDKHKLLGFERMPTVNAISFCFQHPPTAECIADLIHMGMLECAVLEPPQHYTAEAKSKMYDKLLLCVWAPMTIDEWRKKVGLAATPSLTASSELGGDGHQLGGAEPGRVFPAIQQNERLALSGDVKREAVEEAPGCVHSESKVPGAGGSPSHRSEYYRTRSRNAKPPDSDPNTDLL